ncbi:MAG: hypothetical protein AAB968_03290, partial [Patescibacteria group bacterium]
KRRCGLGAAVLAAFSGGALSRSSDCHRSIALSKSRRGVERDTLPTPALSVFLALCLAGLLA